MRNTVLFFVLAVVISFCFASSSLADGNELLRECNAAIRFLDNGQVKPNDYQDVGYCFGFCNGVMSSIYFYNEHLPVHQRLCLPEKGLSTEQVVRIVVKFLKDNPSILHYEQSTLVLLAIGKSYLCSK